MRNVTFIRRDSSWNSIKLISYLLFIFIFLQKNAKMHIPKAQDKVSKGRQCQLTSQAQNCILKLLLINIMIYTSEAGNRVANRRHWQLNLHTLFSCSKCSLLRTISLSMCMVSPQLATEVGWTRKCYGNSEIDCSDNKYSLSPTDTLICLS